MAIETDSDDIKDLIWKIEKTRFLINKGNGAVESPEFLREPLRIERVLTSVESAVCTVLTTSGCHVEATDDVLISDFDVASYYPEHHAESRSHPAT